MKKSRAKKLIKNTIELLTHLTNGQGYASIGLFNAGAGGGFLSGDVTVNLERDGLTLSKKVFTEEELEYILLLACYPHGID